MSSNFHLNLLKNKNSLFVLLRNFTDEEFFVYKKLDKFLKIKYNYFTVVEMKVHIVLEIENCQAHCPWYYADYSELDKILLHYCQYPDHDQIIKDINKIPKNCPLKKFEEK